MCNKHVYIKLFKNKYMKMNFSFLENEDMPYMQLGKKLGKEEKCN